MEGHMGKRVVGLAAVLGLVIAVGVAGSGVAAGQHKRAFTDIALGGNISTNGLNFQAAYKDTNSLNGSGAAVQTGKISGTAFPLSGTDTTNSYSASGLSQTKDKFKLAPPNAKGISAITGSGKCVGGTGIHKHETCSYTLTGTYDTKTTITNVKETGTDTR
jgi:hypothetical protein